MEGFAVYEMEYGVFRIEYDDLGITALHRIKEKSGKTAESEDKQEHGKRTELTDQAAGQLAEYFTGKRQKFDIPCHMKGTEFQIKVWNALCRIPYGETRTYKEIASAVGNPKACRAVGMANNKNPIMIAVPCHRVIGSDGKLIGYAGGLSMKEVLLQLERKYKGI